MESFRNPSAQPCTPRNMCTRPCIMCTWPCILTCTLSSPSLSGPSGSGASCGTRRQRTKEMREQACLLYLHAISLVGRRLTPRGTLSCGCRRGLSHDTVVVIESDHNNKITAVSVAAGKLFFGNGRGVSADLLVEEAEQLGLEDAVPGPQHQRDDDVRWSGSGWTISLVPRGCRTASGAPARPTLRRDGTGGSTRPRGRERNRGDRDQDQQQHHHQDRSRDQDHGQHQEEEERCEDHRDQHRDQHRDRRHDRPAPACVSPRCSALAWPTLSFSATREACGAATRNGYWRRKAVQLPAKAMSWRIRQ